MELKSMNGGNGENSYATNSGLQKVVITRTWPVLDETLKDMFKTGNGFPKNMRVADLGCSSGPNTLSVISHILHTIQHLCKDNNLDEGVEEVEVYLNDLPDNDFNHLFKLLSTSCPNNIYGKKMSTEVSECFVYGAPGSFYGRLFPSNSLHFVYSSYCLHWLSQTPKGLGNKNKENIYIARTSPPEVIEAYAKQFRRDFWKFLRLRSDELTGGGRMVLTFIGRKYADFSSDEGIIKLYATLAETLLDMVAQGTVEKNDLYSFNIPTYKASLQEIEAIIRDEGSFYLEKMEVTQVPMDAHQKYDYMVFDKYRRGKFVADYVRAFMEPLLVSHFGTSLDLDRVFSIYKDKMTDYLAIETDCLSIERTSYFSPIISLTRK